MKKIILFLGLLFLLSGCAYTTGLTRSGKMINYAISKTGAEAADTFFETRKDQICNWVTIGSLKRQFKGDLEGFLQYQSFCSHVNPMLKLGEDFLNVE